MAATAGVRRAKPAAAAAGGALVSLPAAELRELRRKAALLDSVRALLGGADEDEDE